MSTAGLPSSAPSSSSIVLSWKGSKSWLLVKEGCHILLDRCLVKDSLFLATKVPVWGRLSRVEKRAAILKYASAVLQWEPLVRNIIVDSISLAVLEACGNEGAIESSQLDAGKEQAGTGKKKKVAFMQKVLGDALHEMLTTTPDVTASEEETAAVELLQQQRAPPSVVHASIARMRTLWLTPPVATFLLSLADAKLQPPLLFDATVAEQFSIDYFLAPPPSFHLEDERHLQEAIRRDEEDAGKETVFAANLKKALKLQRQVAAAASTGAGRGSSKASDEAVDVSLPSEAALVDVERYVKSLKVSRDRYFGAASAEAYAAGVAAGNLPPVSVTGPNPLSDAVPWAFPDSHRSLPSVAPAAVAASQGARAGWWATVSSTWDAKATQKVGGMAAVMARFAREPAKWAALWRSGGDIMPPSLALAATGLDAEETCNVLDRYPLWLSFRGMVGTNLYADGIWPITNNDGHLTLVKFRRSDKARFWYLDVADADPGVLCTAWLAWARMLQSGIRFEVAMLGKWLQDAVSAPPAEPPTTHTWDDVARAVQRHLEAAIMSHLTLKIVTACMEVEALQASQALGTELVLEEEAQAAKAKAKEREREEKRKAAAAKAKAEAEAKAAKERAEAEARAKAEAAAAAAVAKAKAEAEAKEREVDERRQALVAAAEREEKERVLRLAKEAEAARRRKAAQEAEAAAAIKHAAATAAASKQASVPLNPPAVPLPGPALKAPSAATAGSTPSAPYAAGGKSATHPQAVKAPAEAQPPPSTGPVGPSTLPTVPSGGRAGAPWAQQAAATGAAQGAKVAHAAAPPPLPPATASAAVVAPVSPPSKPGSWAALAKAGTAGAGTSAPLSVPLAALFGPPLPTPPSAQAGGGNSSSVAALFGEAPTQSALAPTPVPHPSDSMDMKVALALGLDTAGKPGVAPTATKGQFAAAQGGGINTLMAASVAALFADSSAPAATAALAAAAGHGTGVEMGVGRTPAGKGGAHGRSTGAAALSASLDPPPSPPDADSTVVTSSLAGLGLSPLLEGPGAGSAHSSSSAHTVQAVWRAPHGDQSMASTSGSSSHASASIHQHHHHHPAGGDPDRGGAAGPGHGGSGGSSTESSVGLLGGLLSMSSLGSSIWGEAGGAGQSGSDTLLGGLPVGTVGGGAGAGHGASATNAAGMSVGMQMMGPTGGLGSGLTAAAGMYPAWGAPLASSATSGFGGSLLPLGSNSGRHNGHTAAPAFSASAPAFVSTGLSQAPSQSSSTYSKPAGPPPGLGLAGMGPANPATGMGMGMGIGVGMGMNGGSMGEAMLLGMQQAQGDMSQSQYAQLAGFFGGGSAGLLSGFPAGFLSHTPSAAVGGGQAGGAFGVVEPGQAAAAAALLLGMQTGMGMQGRGFDTGGSTQGGLWLPPSSTMPQGISGGMGMGMGTGGPYQAAASSGQVGQTMPASSKALGQAAGSAWGQKESNNGSQRY